MTAKQPTILIEKHIGETPLEAINRFKSNHPEYREEKMTYAGRLDPMAEGLLLVLVGEECKKKDKYLGLDKTYEIEILFGFATDTYDALGKIIENDSLENFSFEKVVEELAMYRGTYEQPFPPYSAPFWEQARSGNLDETDLPIKNIEIYSIEILARKEISAQELLLRITDSIAKVIGDFRQKEIIALWEKFLNNSHASFPILSVRISCSSGTYMRSLAQKLGKSMHIPALALSIKRTRIGEYTI